MAGQTIILAGPSQRAFARQLVDTAPSGAVVNIRDATRNLDQNAKMWAMLSDVSRAKGWRPMTRLPPGSAVILSALLGACVYVAVVWWALG